MPAPLELTGHSVGRLTVLRRVENSASGYARWLCLCRCGRQTVVKASYLNRARTRSCGCAWTEAWQVRNARKFRDLTGKRFGRLKVEEMVFRRKKRLFWRCRCECGSEMVIDGHSLKSGATKSCGCLQRERASAARRRACATAPRSKGRFAGAAAAVAGPS